MGTRGDEARFRGVLEALAGDPAGWQGPAGDAFVELMSELLDSKAASVAAKGSGGFVDPSDVVSEAVLVVNGQDLRENAARILGMQCPLGYVISSVSAEVDRSVLEGEMGVSSRKVTSGVKAVQHYEEYGQDEAGQGLEHLAAEAVWGRAAGESSREASTTCRAFASVLIGRFRIPARVVSESVEVAADVAVDGEVTGGATPSRTKRRLSLFTGEAVELRKRAGLDREQVSAMGGLLFGSERHPEWSLLVECGRAGREDRAVNVSTWQTQRARTVARRPGMARRAATRGVRPSLEAQPALFDTTGQGRMVIRRA